MATSVGSGMSADGRCTAADLSPRGRRSTVALHDVTRHRVDAAHASHHPQLTHTSVT